MQQYDIDELIRYEQTAKKELFKIKGILQKIREGCKHDWYEDSEHGCTLCRKCKEVKHD